jgi:hypothetical protein
MSSLATNAITDASGGNTTTINGLTPTVSNMAGRNRIINGNFDIWQRGTSFSGISYTADRWYQTWNGAGTTRATSYQNSDQSLWGDFSRFARVANTAAPTGQTFNKFVQRIEYVTTLADKTITVSFKAKSSSASTLSVTLEQNFGSGGSTAVTVDPSFSEVLTSDWVDYSFTVALPSISGKTVGSSHYLELTFNLPLNSTFEIDIAQVQLEAGSVATPFEHRQYGQELALCQRYYQITDSMAGSGRPSGTEVSMMAVFCTPMRSSPTVSSFGGVITVTEAGVVDRVQSSTSVNIESARVSTRGAQLYFGNFSSITSQRPYLQNTNGNGAAFNAEL